MTAQDPAEKSDAPRRNDAPRRAPPRPPPGVFELDAPSGTPNEPTESPMTRPQAPPSGQSTPGTNEEHCYNFSYMDHANAPDHPPPAYTELPGQINNDTGDLGTNAVVADDGRVNITIHQKSGRLTQIFQPQIRQQISQLEHEPAPPPPYIPESLGGAPGQEPPPPLNVVIHVVGSRGDVQPFVALGKVLKNTYGHRVRLATHPTFKDFVTEHGLEFFSIGGDPAELMAFMVKNPGLMPGFDTIRSGDVGKRRRGIAEILRGTWRSCIETGDGLGVDPVKQSVEEWINAQNNSPGETTKCFIADVIIANPPSFGHIHCAEKLGIPLHMMFTMPWSPTQQFPHPLADIKSSNADPSITNYMSYTLVDMLTWQGLGDIINKFRRDSLSLEPISMLWAPGMLARLKIPYTYCWSPALIPKPKDWGHHISIAGFYFLEMARNYTPAPDLKAFLDAGEAPVYIGFGSIVVDDPNAMTTMIFEAVKKTGKRALVSKGWGGLGADELGVPEGVFMLGNVPHDWLFQHVSCVVHHGGAGTTAAGIAAGRPTVVVPFFGDQPFWGAMTAKAGAGPAPIPYKNLTSDKLAEAIQEALKPESLERAKDLSKSISKEQGDHKGAQSFHQMLKLDELRCSVAANRPAVWRVRRTTTRLSAVAASVLAQAGELSFSDLKLYRPTEYETDEGPWDPITGGATAILGTMTTMLMGFADFPVETMKLLSVYPDGKKDKGKQPVGGSESSATNKASDTGHPGRKSLHRSASSNSSSVHRATTPPTSPGDSGVSSSTRPSFMCQAMRASSQNLASPSRDQSPGEHSKSFLRPRSRNSRSNSQSGTEIQSSTGPTFMDKVSKFNPDSAVSTGKGLAKIVGAGIKSPMDFSLNVAKGFHNVPKLYGDEVRQVDKVTDLQSGVKTAAKEFGLGFYEGLSGLVMDPYRGAKKEGGAGFVKGIGKGIAGVPLRIMGGVFAVPGYAMKGLYQEALKEQGADIQKYIMAARMSQGSDEMLTLSHHEKADILAKWKVIKLHLKKKKNPGEKELEALHTLMKEHKLKKRERWQKSRDGHFKTRPEARPTFPPSMTDNSSYSDHGVPGEDHGIRTSTENNSSNIPPPSQTSSQPNTNTGNTHQENQAIDDAEARELEEAIRLSISHTANHDPTEDELMARAIRASITELQSTPGDSSQTEEETLQRAIHASLEEANRNGATAEEQRMLEDTLRKSLLETGRQQGSDSENEWDSGDDTEDDQNYRRVIADSAAPDAVAGASADDKEIERILEESEALERQRREELAKQKTEEDVVMEYVKRQSLMEEEHRRRMVQGRRDVEGGGGGESSGAAKEGVGK